MIFSKFEFSTRRDKEGGVLPRAEGRPTSGHAQKVAGFHYSPIYYSLLLVVKSSYPLT